jgi:hypothetical protein
MKYLTSFVILNCLPNFIYHFRNFCIIPNSTYYFRHVRPSARPHVSARLPLDGFPLHLILATSMKIRRRNPNLITNGQKYRKLCIQTLSTFHYLHKAQTDNFTGRHYALGARCWWRSCLRHCATNRKIAGSIPDGVIGIFH